MATLNETPSGNRIRIAFFGLRNAGKSTLVNAFTGQPLAIVSATPGTTTDPVSKAMEILPLGPCLITDTAGLDDEGELGAMRVRKTLDVLATTDIAVWVWGEELKSGVEVEERNFKSFISECERRGVAVVEYRRGESVEELKKKIASIKLADEMPGLLDGLVKAGDRVICVCPIDESAPKDRLILPQVQVIRACLDLHVPCSILQPDELAEEVRRFEKLLVITDSQAFGEVKKILAECQTPTAKLTSFSVLFARQKGDLAAFAQGVAAIGNLKDGDTVLVAEGCTHHRQCNDIGSVKIPKALEKMSGKKLKFVFASGNDFNLQSSTPALVVHCGGCMLTRREVLRRIARAQEAGVPIVNYGMLLAAANGIDVASLAV